MFKNTFFTQNLQATASINGEIIPFNYKCNMAMTNSGVKAFIMGVRLLQKEITIQIVSISFLWVLW